MKRRDSRQGASRGTRARTRASTAQSAVQERAATVAADPQLQLIAEYASDAIGRFKPDGTCLYASPASRTVFGYEPEELIGTSAYDLIPSGDSRAPIEVTRDLVTTGETPSTVTHRVRRKDSRIIWVETTARGRRNPATGEVDEIVCVSRDVTARKEAEEALQRSENRLRTLLENSSDGIVLLDARGVTRFASPAIRGILGYSPDAVVGRSGLDLLHPDDRAAASETAAELQRNPDRTVTTCFRHRHRDGSWRYLEAVNRNLLHEPGIQAVVVNFRDVTARQKAAQALRDSEDRYRLLFDQNPQPIYVCDRRTLDFLAVNEAAIRQYGYSRKEFLGMKVTQIRPPEDVPDFLQRFGRVEENLVSHGEFRHQRKDGSCFPVEVFARTIDFADRPGMIVLLTDLTQRKLAEARLRESEELHRILFDQNPQPIYLFDFETLNVLAVNDAMVAKYGYSKDEFLKMRATDIRPHEEVPRFLKAVPSDVGGAPYKGEYRHRTKSGEIFDVEIYARDLRIGGRQVWLVLTNDITARKASEARLRASEAVSRSLVENAPEAIITMDAAGTIRSVNRAEPGVRLDQLLGHTVFEFVREEDGQRIRETLHRVIRTGEAETIEAAGLGPSLQPGWFRARVGRMKDAVDGAELIIIASNISEEKRMRDELLQTHRSLEQQSVALASTIETRNREIDRRERVERELRDSRRRLRGLSTRLLSAQEEERRRIAREVHDELGQGLTAMKMELAADERDRLAGRDTHIARAEQVGRLIDGAIQTVRRIATDLRPGALDDLGLEAALDGLTGDFSQRSGIPCRLTLVPEDLGLDPTVSTTIFRVVQEALTNVARHANATTVKVDLRRRAGEVLLRVRDDGRGITPEEAADAKSLGLIGIRERVRLCGGGLRLRALKDRGTELRVEIPVPGQSSSPGANRKSRSRSD